MTSGKVYGLTMLFTLCALAIGIWVVIESWP